LSPWNTGVYPAYSPPSPTSPATVGKTYSSATFLHFDMSEDLSLSSQKETEECVIYTFVASALFDGWRAGFLFHYLDEDDEDEMRREIIAVTKKLCAGVFNQPDDGWPFYRKLRRTIKAMMDEQKYMPERMFHWYQEDGSRGNFHYRDDQLGGLLFSAARLAITANLF